MMKTIDYYISRRFKHIFKVDHDTKQVHVRNYIKEWDICFDYTYYKIIKPTFSSRLFRKYKKLSDEEAFIKLL